MMKGMVIFELLVRDGNFPKLGGTFLGVPIFRIIVCWGLCWGPVFLGTTRFSTGCWRGNCARVPLLEVEQDIQPCPISRKEKADL